MPLVNQFHLPKQGGNLNYSNKQINTLLKSNPDARYEAGEWIFIPLERGLVSAIQKRSFLNLFSVIKILYSFLLLP